jgi:hypothetical protein
MSVKEFYQWDNKNIGISVDFDPKIFDSASNLIQKNTPQEKVLILSKYSSLLYYISNKNSYFDTFDFMNDLVRSDQIHEYKNIINSVQPEFIYVDHNYNSMLTSNIIINDTAPKYIQNESIWYYFRLLNLVKFTEEILKNYKIYETSDLIDVYVKK